jgi:hypothetical protein
MTREKYCKVFLTMAAVILISLTSLPQVAAQEKDFSKFTMHGGVGLMNPLGNLAKNVTTGYSVTVGGGYNFSKRLALVGEYFYNQPQVEDEVLNSLAVVIGKVKVWAVTGDAVLRMNRPGKIDFYGIAGAGLYQRKVKFPGATATPVTITNNWWGYTGTLIINQGSVIGGRSSSAFGFNIGGGMTFPAYKGFRGYVEARYHHAFTNVNDTQMLPITAGIRW